MWWKLSVGVHLYKFCTDRTALPPEVLGDESETSVDFIVAVACNTWLLRGDPIIKANIFVYLQMCRTPKKMSWYIKSGSGKRRMVPGESLFIFVFFFPLLLFFFSQVKLGKIKL